MITEKFKIDGMSCAHCVGTVKTAVSKLPGVTDVDIDLLKGTATVTGQFDAQEVLQAIATTGYTAKRLFD